jgi:hypothetical protein
LSTNITAPLDDSGSVSDYDEEDCEALKSIAFGAMELDLNILSTALTTGASSDSDVSSAYDASALRRVLVVSHGYNAQAQNLVQNEQVTIVELPTNIMAGLQADFGMDLDPEDSDWQRLTRASMNLLACGPDGSLQPQAAYDELVSRVALETGVSAEELKQETRRELETLPSSSEFAVELACLPSLPVLQPVDTVTRTAAIVAGTRIVCNVSRVSS